MPFALDEAVCSYSVKPGDTVRCREGFRQPIATDAVQHPSEGAIPSFG